MAWECDECGARALVGSPDVCPFCGACDTTPSTWLPSNAPDTSAPAPVLVVGQSAAAPVSAPHGPDRLREVLATLVYWHDQGHIDESWWEEAAALLATDDRRDGES